MNQIEYQKKIIREEYIENTKKESRESKHTNSQTIPTKKNRAVLIQK